MTPAEVYSQGSEQEWILKHTPAKGRFLDIGAYHPKYLSNTRALYERGWGGVFVEPLPAAVEHLIREYGNDDRVTVVCAAVGAERSVIPLWASDKAVTTNDPKVHELWKDDGGYYGRFHIPTITIEDITNQFGAFDFVNIDTEGSSVDILHRVLSIPMDPTCICVEHDTRYQEITGLISKRGYAIVHGTGENLILVRQF